MMSTLFGPAVALGDLETTLVRRESDFHDELVPANRLQFHPTDGMLGLGGERHRVQPHAFDQLASKLQVPVTYLRRCPHHLRATNLNFWLEDLDGDVLVRFDGEEVRAVLSDRYNPLSNLDLVRTMLTTCPPETLVRWESDPRMFAIQVLQPHEEQALVGGMFARNSETGHTTLELNAMVYRVICTNGLILSGGSISVVRRHTHDASKTLAEVRSTVASSWPRVGGEANRFEAMKRIRAQPVDKVFERVNSDFALNEAQTTAVSTAYQFEPGITLFDVINAYTRAGNAPALSIEERTQLQTVGGHILSRAENGRSWI